MVAEDVVATQPLPPFPASIKDGYAVCSADGEGDWPVAGSLAAGDDPSSVVMKPVCDETAIHTG